MQLGNLKNIRNVFQPLRACGFWVCFTLSTVSSDANAQGFGKESDMVKGAKNNSVGIMERGFIEGNTALIAEAVMVTQCSSLLQKTVMNSVFVT